MAVKSIMIVGVGGQGTLLASRLLGNALIKLGFDIKVSEVHGMAQRGGSVVTYVKYGDKVHSPIIEKGEADVILSFEQLEAARWLEMLKPGGKMIVNSQKISPMPVITGSASYPEGLIEKIKDTGADTVSVDALELANQTGSLKTVNIVLIGKLATYLDFDKEIWYDSIKETVPERFIEQNIKAFELGYNS